MWRNRVTGFGAHAVWWSTVASLALLVSACSVATNEAGSDGETFDGFSVASSLALLPASAVADLDSYQVDVADVTAAADIARVRRPAQNDDRGQLIDFLGPITGFHPDGDRMRVFVALPQTLRNAAQEPTAYIEEFGFGVAEVESFASVSSIPPFIVLAGVDPRADLPEVAPGIVTVGEGEDGVADLDGRSSARPLGRPHRIATRDGLVAIGFDTPQLSEWRDAASMRTLADDDQLLGVAQLLDESEVVSASLYRSVGETSYTIAGLGWTEDDDGPLGVIVLSYESQAFARNDLDRVTGSFSAESFTTREPLSDLITLDSVDLRGADIVAFVRFPGTRQPRLLFDILITRDGPFAS